jgi:branched-chain amino acid transport system substrate-binding protein
VAATFMTLSNNASAGFAEEVGDFGCGIIVGQVTPPGTGASRLGRELHQLMSKPPEATISYAAMEAYAAAKVMVEGLKRAGPNLTREGFVRRWSRCAASISAGWRSSTRPRGERVPTSSS